MQIVQCRRNARDEMGFLLKAATETIRSQHLHGAEEDNAAQTLVEVGRHIGAVLLVNLDEFGLYLVRIACRGLPKEAGEVV